MYRLATFRTRPASSLRLHQRPLIRHGTHPPTQLHSTAPPHPLARSTIQGTTLHNQRATPVHSSILSSLRTYLLGTTLILSSFFTYLYLTDTRSAIHLLTPTLLQSLYPDAEDAHEAGNAWLRSLYTLGLHPRERNRGVEESDLSITLFNGTHTLDNPIGTSAGIDKLAEIPDALFAMGPAIVEVGGATPHPQSGNPRPRVFRLPSQRGLVNRYGLNSEGADDMAMRLRRRVRAFALRSGLGGGDVEAGERMIVEGRAGVPRGSLQGGRLLAVQVAKNKDTDAGDVDAVAGDYAYCVERLARWADVIVVNVSSPNTPNLRTLQSRDPLTKILSTVVRTASRSSPPGSPPAIMVKVSPDEDTDPQIRGIVSAVSASGVDGVIVGNTTKRRHDLDARIPAREARIWDSEEGGYSGPALFPRTLALVKRYRTILDESPPPSTSPSNDDSSPPTRKAIFASGGITTGTEALAVLEAGADVVQVYTAVVYGGVGVVGRMKGEMRAAMRERLRRGEGRGQGIGGGENGAEQMEREIEDRMLGQPRL